MHASELHISLEYLLMFIHETLTHISRCENSFKTSYFSKLLYNYSKKQKKSIKLQADVRYFDAETEHT